jgi:ribosomal protein S6--L-glutamate ligase
MKIAILSRNIKLYSTKRLVEAGRQRGHEVAVIDPLRCYIDIAAQHAGIFYRGQHLAGFDAVIPRIGASITFYGAAVLRQFEMMGVFALNESVAVVRSRDKLRSLQILTGAGLGLPRTAFAHAVEDIPTLVELAGGAPVIVKLLSGTQGKGVVLAETNQAAISVIDAFRELNADFLVQEFIAEAEGADIRCFVIGKRVVAAMQRQAQAGEFRSNLHRGGQASLVRITPEERRVAARAAAKLGLNVAGVDLIRSRHGPLVLEVNSSPGLEGIERATQRDIAAKIIEYIEINAQLSHTRSRGKG